MPAVERIVLVVAPDEDGGGTRHRREAVLSDGRRIRDPGYRGGSCLLSLFGPLPTADELRADGEEHRTKMDRDPRSFDLLAKALRHAGVDIEAQDLAALPIDVEIGPAEPVAVPPPSIAQRISFWAFWIAVGAIWPSMNRYRAWRRRTWRQRIRRGLASWAFSLLMSELFRRRRERWAAGQSR